jgi:hypothetical protein
LGVCIGEPIVGLIIRDVSEMARPKMAADWDYQPPYDAFTHAATWPDWYRSSTVVRMEPGADCDLPAGAGS